jgi:transcriptional regulator with XRE-family HTH domain
MNEMTTFGERVRQLRKQRGLTQLGLANAAGLTQPTIWRIEQGKLLELKHGALSRLAEALKTSMDYLAGRGTPVPSEIDDPGLRELLEFVTSLTPEERADVLSTAAGIARVMTISSWSESPDPMRRQAAVDFFAGIDREALAKAVERPNAPADPPPALTEEPLAAKTREAPKQTPGTSRASSRHRKARTRTAQKRSAPRGGKR